eukprot:Polyplicarium_translucidae@DN3134_c0_g1_i1.p1
MCHDAINAKVYETPPPSPGEDWHTPHASEGDDGCAESLGISSDGRSLHPKGILKNKYEAPCPSPRPPRTTHSETSMALQAEGRPKTTPQASHAAHETTRLKTALSTPLETFPPFPPSQKHFFVPDPPAISPSEAHRITEALEQRLRQCENLVGSPKAFEIPTSTPGNTDSYYSLGTPGSAKNVPVDGAPSFRIANLDWLEDVQVAVTELNAMRATNDEGADGTAEASKSVTTVVQILRRFLRLTDELYQGRVAQFEQKYQELTSWLQSENASLSATILTREAKKAYLLENEPFLRRTAEDLKTFEDLRQYTNAESLRGVATHADRLALIEQRGGRIATGVLELESQLHQLAVGYNTAMNTVAALLKEWEARMPPAAHFPAAGKVEFRA